MPQLLGLLLFGAAAIAGYKSFQRAMSRATGRTSDGANRVGDNTDMAETPGMKDLGALELDPQTGVYKPRN